MMKPTIREQLESAEFTLKQDAAKLRQVIAILESLKANDDNLFYEIGRAIGTAKTALWNHPKEASNG